MTREKFMTEKEKLARAYSKSKTFTYIKEVINNRSTFYNGYIVKVMTDMIVFYDIILKREFPILLETIEVIEPSRKEEERRE